MPSQFTPLTTAWAPPASCATAIPTIYAGTCNTRSCSASSAAGVTRALSSAVFVNNPHYTSAGVMTSTACMPPGYLALESFFFTPATACPTGFTTASTTRGYSSQTTVGCCPTGFTATWDIGNVGYDCYKVSSFSSGQPFSLVARGQIRETITSLDFWFSESFISTTAWPVATTATVLHPAVNLLVGAAATGSSFGGGSGSTAAAGAAFSLLGLGLAASIGILIAIACGGLCCVGGCLFFCIRGMRRRKVVPVNAVANVQQAPPVVASYGSPQQQPGFSPYGAPPQPLHSPTPQYGTPPPAQYGTPPPPQYGYGPPQSQYGAYKGPDSHVTPA